MRRAIAKLPGELVRTITWDQGKEMARHAALAAIGFADVEIRDDAFAWACHARRPI